MNCKLCPRNCTADREAGQTGVCGQTAELKVARAALHFWEEPCISGEKGSGTVFFSGCPLHCVFCQNREIANGTAGKRISIERLTEIFLELQEKGANNINLVTPGHFVPQILAALEAAKQSGLALPVVYNSGGYEAVETLRMLDGMVDIYLPDFKYMDGALAARYSHAPDYVCVAKAALAEMVRQTGEAVFEGADGEGLMRRGTIVRHLALPGHIRDSMAVLDYLHETYGNTIYISIMNQFTPLADPDRYPELARPLTKREYRRLLDHAAAIGIQNGFFQEGATAKESFIPPFDCEGV